MTSLARLGLALALSLVVSDAADRVSRVSARQTGTAAVPDAAQARILAGTARLYDTVLLHHIAIVITAEDAERLIARTEERVRATVTVDGQTVRNTGVRQSGGIYHTYQPITNKPSLSLKFDEFVPGQRLFGLSKVILKNELQDVSFVSEHLTYEIFRRAGLAAPLTAHAQVTINGVDSGIYELREPINKQFLARNFGSGDTDGDLYEIENTQDFVFDPSYPALDDEGVKGRTRARIERLAAAVRRATPDSFEREMAPLVDLDRLVTYVAAEAATGHWDGFVSRNNNSYLYARESDGRFIVIPWGADQALGISRGRGRFGGGFSVQSMLVRAMLAVPTLAARVDAEIERLQRPPVWDDAVLGARLDRVATILGSVETPSGRTAIDLAQFATWRQTVQALIARNGNR